MDDYSKAEPLYQKALQIKKIAVGENHPDYATSLNNLALQYISMGDYTKAESLLQKALELEPLRKAYGISYTREIANIAEVKKNYVVVPSS